MWNMERMGSIIDRDRKGCFEVHPDSFPKKEEIKKKSIAKTQSQNENL